MQLQDKPIFFSQRPPTSHSICHSAIFQHIQNNLKTNQI